jgi:hypothetical protein
MAKYSVEIVVSIPEPVLTTGGMVGELGKSDTKLSRARGMGD